MFLSLVLVFSLSLLFSGPETNAGILPRSLNVIFSSIEGHTYTQMNLKPQRCREFVRLTANQQNEEAAVKRSLFKLLKEVLISVQQVQQSLQNAFI